MSDKLSTINRGKTAQITLDWMGAIFIQQKEQLLIDLKNLYRTGNASESKLLAVVSGLCTIDDIEYKLKRLVNQGNSASKEMINERESRNAD